MMGIDIYLEDLKEQKRKEIEEHLHKPNNYDVFPIATAWVGEPEED